MKKNGKIIKGMYNILLGDESNKRKVSILKNGVYTTFESTNLTIAKAVSIANKQYRESKEKACTCE